MSKKFCWLASGFWLLFILACGAHRPEAQGEPSQGAAEAMYRRCQRVIQNQQCHGDMDVSCISSIANGYYELDTYEERQRYLIQWGCPPAMVQ